MAVYQYDDNHYITKMDYYTYGGTLKYTVSTYIGTGIGTPVLKYETSYTYNAYGLPTVTSTVSVDGNLTSSTTYDTGSTNRTFGAVLSETDSLGRVTRFFYDAKNGDLKAIINPDETGLAKVTMQVSLTFACMNLKKLVKWKRISSLPVDFLFSRIYKTTHSFDFAGSEWFWSTV